MKEKDNKLNWGIIKFKYHKTMTYSTNFFMIRYDK